MTPTRDPAGYDALPKIVPARRTTTPKHSKTSHGFIKPYILDVKLGIVYYDEKGMHDWHC